MADQSCRASESGSGAVLVWDVEGDPVGGFDVTALWRAFDATPLPDANVVSLPRLVEAGADDLRARYLAWIHALGAAMAGGQSVAERFTLRPGLSYWWLAAPAQKFSISAVSLVPDAIKMLAFERYLDDRDVRSITLESENLRLAECLSAYCRHHGYSFDWRRRDAGEVASPGRGALYRRLPPTLRAIISLARFCVSRLSSARPAAATARPLGTMSVFDVLIHLDRSSPESGRFASNYWGPLVRRLDEAGIRSNWFHIFHPQPAVAKFRQAVELAQRFTAASDGRQWHQMVDGMPGIATVVRAVRDFFRIGRAARASLPALKAVRPEGSVLTLWPFHEDEWNESVCGPNALMECLRLGGFETELARLPRQEVGLYLCENQPWEHALIHAWRSRGHGTLIAVPHSTVRYWDLRYFHDPRTYVEAGASRRPLPDRYALNGPVAMRMMVDAGVPREKLVPVEALRFMYLEHGTMPVPAGMATFTLLVCGDFLTSTNDWIFELLSGVGEHFPRGSRIVFKPHPAFPYAPPDSLQGGVEVLVDERSLSALLPECHIVISSAITSAAVDAYCAGRPVIQVASGRGLNANALRGVDGVALVATPAELADALTHAVSAQAPRTRSEHYFHLDSALPGWMNMLRRGRSPDVTPTAGRPGDI